MSPLLARLHRLLAGDHHHRHRAQLGIGGRGDEVGGAGSERGETDPGLAGEAAVGRGHEARTLFVSREHELDARGAQRLEQIEVLLAGNAENVLDSFGFQRPHEQVRRLHHALPLVPVPDRIV
jgi:hypothetical protein